MFYVDNPTGVPVMPPLAPVMSQATLYFTEGGNGIPPTYPGPDWFNITQSELINVVKEAGMLPDKAELNQLVMAIKRINGTALAEDALMKVRNGADIPDKSLFIDNLGLRETVNKARDAVPSTRRVNNKPLSSDITLSAGDVNAWTKEEADRRYQGTGSTIDAYTKQESDARYLSASYSAIQGWRWGARGSATNGNGGGDAGAHAPDGAAVVAIWEKGDWCRVDFRYAQYLFNGTWYNAGAI